MTAGERWWKDPSPPRLRPPIQVPEARLWSEVIALAISDSMRSRRPLARYYALEAKTPADHRHWVQSKIAEHARHFIERDRARLFLTRSGGARDRIFALLGIDPDWFQSRLLPVLRERWAEVDALAPPAGEIEEQRSVVGSARARKAWATRRQKAAVAA